MNKPEDIGPWTDEQMREEIYSLREINEEMVKALEMAAHWIRISPLEGLGGLCVKTLTAVEAAIRKARGEQ